MTAAELVARLADRGIVLGARGEELNYRGPNAALTPDVLEALAAHKGELLDLLRRDRFTRPELDALGFKGTKCVDGSGMFEVRVGGSIEILILRLALFDVEPEIRGDELWLVAPKDNPEVVLPPKLLEEARARAGELYAHLQARAGAGRRGASDAK